MNCEWQPISTAPKDGSEVVLFIPGDHNRHVVIGSWDDAQYSRRPRPYWTSDGARIWGVRWSRDNQPTHWMPLPQPPQAVEDTL